MNAGFYVSCTGKKITTRRIEAPSATTLKIGGIVIVGQYLNSPGGAMFGETITHGTATMIGALVIGVPT